MGRTKYLDDIWSSLIFGRDGRDCDCSTELVDECVCETVYCFVVLLEIGCHVCGSLLLVDIWPDGRLVT